MLKAPQASVASILTSTGVTGSVGPTSATGWTAAWLDTLPDQEIDLASAGTFLLIDDLPSGTRMVLRDEHGAAMALTWPPQKEDAPADAAARQLASMFGAPEAAAKLEALLTDADHDAETLTSDLADVVELPELIERSPRAAAVFTRADVAIVRLAGAIAGPTWLTEAGDGWTIAQSTVEPEEAEFAGAELAASISAAGSRRDRTLLLWRDGEASGFTIWRHGSIEGIWSWNGRWRDIDDDEAALTKETVCAEALAAIARDRPDMFRLRELLRRGDHAEDALSELAVLLGIPCDSLTVLDQATTPRPGPQAELVKRSTPSAAWWATVRQPRSRPVHGWLRPIYLAYTVGTIVAALFSTGMAILGIGVIATGGSLIDEPQVTFEDWAFTGLFALLSVTLVPTAVFRVRRLRMAETTESEAPQGREQAEG